MSRMVADRLWPMLLALLTLVGGALALEQYARARGNDALVIAVQDADPGVVAPSEDDDAEPTASWAEPVSEAHAKARSEAQRGNTRKALELFAQEAKAHPDSAALADERGFWLLSDGQEQPARAELERAKTLAPKDPGVALHLGQAEYRLGNRVAALAELERALALRPGFGSAQRALGKLYRREKRYDEAIALLTDAASSGSNEERARALAELGAAQLAAGKRDDAERSFDRAIEYAPARVEIRIAIARAWLAGDESDRARAAELLARGAELAPDLPQVHSLYGRTLERLGDREGATRAYERALQLDPTYRHVRRRLLRLALDRRELDRARQHADALIAADAEDPEHHFLAALIADRDGRTDDARAAYGRAVEKAKGSYPEAVFNLGLLEKRAGRLKEAIAAYQQAIAQRPDYVAARNNLALAYKAKGDLAAAEQQLRETLTVDPRYGPAQSNLAEVLVGAGKLDEGLAAYHRALELRPSHRATQLGLVEALLKARRAQDALRTARQVVEGEPRLYAGWLKVSEAALAAGKPDDARGALRQAIEIDAEQREAYVALAKLEERTGALESAQTAWQELVDRNPADRAAQLGLAHVYARRGDSKGCIRTVGLVLSRGPEDPQAQSLRRQCAAAPSSPQENR